MACKISLHYDCTCDLEHLCERQGRYSCRDGTRASTACR